MKIDNVIFKNSTEEDAIEIDLDDTEVRDLRIMKRLRAKPGQKAWRELNRELLSTANFFPQNHKPRS
jgi:hypothetical protein